MFYLMRNNIKIYYEKQKCINQQHSLAFTDTRTRV